MYKENNQQEKEQENLYAESWRIQNKLVDQVWHELVKAPDKRWKNQQQKNKVEELCTSAIRIRSQLQNLSAKNEHTFLDHDGKKYSRVAYDGKFGVVCDDCGSKIGEYHGLCDIEICPKCKGQFMCCGCEDLGLTKEQEEKTEKWLVEHNKKD